MKKTLRKGYYWKGKKVDIKPQDVEEKGKKKGEDIKKLIKTKRSYGIFSSLTRPRWRFTRADGIL